MKKRLLKIYYLLQLQKFKNIDISNLNYEEILKLLNYFHDNEIIVKEIINSENFLKLLQKEENNTLKIFKTMYSFSIRENRANNIKFIEHLLNSQLESDEIEPFKYLIDAIIDIYFKENSEELENLIYDLISKFLVLNKLSNNMMKFYVLSATKNDCLEKFVKTIKITRKKSSKLASYSPLHKCINFYANTVDKLFKERKISDYLMLNRVILQILEHELDHAYTQMFYSAYSVLDKGRISNKEFYYFNQSEKIIERIKVFDYPQYQSSIGLLCSEHRANTFGYLKSLKRIKKYYGRFLSKENIYKISANTLQNIFNLYILTNRTPYSIQTNIYQNMFRKSKEIFKEEFIPISFMKTKELFENIFEREFNEEILMELHRIMIGDNTLHNIELFDKNMQNENGFDVFNEIVERTNKTL